MIYLWAPPLYTIRDSLFFLFLFLLPRWSRWRGEAAGCTGFTAHWFLVDWIKSQREGQSAEQLRKKRSKNIKKKREKEIVSYPISLLNPKLWHSPWIPSSVLSMTEHYRTKSGTMTDKYMEADKDQISSDVQFQWKFAWMIFFLINEVAYFGIRSFSPKQNKNP